MGRPKARELGNSAKPSSPTCSPNGKGPGVPPAQVAKELPDTFLRIIGSVMPKVLDLDGSVTIRSELAIEISNFAQAYELWGKHVGAAPPMIDVSPEEDLVQDDD